MSHDISMLAPPLPHRSTAHGQRTNDCFRNQRWCKVLIYSIVYHTQRCSCYGIGTMAGHDHDQGNEGTTTMPRQRPRWQRKEPGGHAPRMGVHLWNDTPRPPYFSASLCASSFPIPQGWGAPFVSRYLDPWVVTCFVSDFLRIACVFVLVLSQPYTMKITDIWKY